MNEFYEVFQNLPTILESFTEEQKLAISIIVDFEFIFLIFFPKIAFWIIRVFKRLIEFITYLYNLYKTKLKSILRKDDKNENI